MELTTREAAEKLGVSLRQIQTLIKQERLPAEKRGRDWLIKEEDLELVKDRPKTGRPPKAKDDETLKENPASGLERQN